MEENMEATAILAIAGVILSLLFEYMPGLHTWYNGLVDNWQRVIMLCVILLVVGGAFGLSCYHWLNIFACTGLGVREAVLAFIAALVANQSTHRILPKVG
jgi:hypothetical protein